MEFTHFNDEGRARMVDVTEKSPTVREAIAAGTIHMSPATITAVRQGQIAKGDVLAVAQVAGIQAAKHTWELIPMCHPLQLGGIDISFTVHDDRIDIRATVRCKGDTGVEMEALTAVSAGLLTIYDMCKALQKDMTITDICLLRKSGGKSGDFVREE